MITSNAPGGVSVGQLTHYLQIINGDGVMRRYNDGKSADLPEAYDLSLISAPVALYYGENDWLSSEKVNCIKFNNFFTYVEFFFFQFI